MILLELAAQGIRGAVSASGRATFRPGYVVVPGGGDAFCPTIGALLWCDTVEGEALRTAAGQPIRAGATFTTPDRTLYRLVTDFASEFQLQRYDAAARTFSPAASGRAAVQAWVRAQTGLTSRDAFDDLLSISAAHLPSRAAAQARASAPPPPPPAAEPDRIRARLDELRADLGRSRDVDGLQQRVDELQSRLFKLEEALREGARLEGEIESAQGRLKALGLVVDAADELGDPEARLAAYERALARRDEVLARISEEREALAEATPPPALWRQPQLWGGIVAGAAALSVGMASSGALRYVALLDVPAFGWSAWTALRWVGRLEAGERAGRRTRVVDERERKALEQWEAESAAVRRAMAVAGVKELAELRKALEAVAEARAAIRAATDALGAWRERPETQEAQREYAQVEAEAKEADGRLAELATGFVRDVGTLEAEIARLEGELEAEVQPRRGSAGAPLSSGDVVVELARHAATLIGGPEDPARVTVESRAAEILAVIAGRRLERLWADPDGKVVVQPAGGRVRFAELPPDGRDLCWTALKLALVEHALERGRGFAVVDSALDALPLVARRVAAHILKRAARAGQVLHATADPVFREAADHAA